MRRLARALVALAMPALGGGCAGTKGFQLPWEHPSIAQVAPAPPVPLTPPSRVMHAAKGTAPASYPASFGAGIKPDGKILFPQGTEGHIKEGAVYAGGNVVATVTRDGEVFGKGLKHRYRFTKDGDLVDDEGRGVRLSPTGGVRAMGGPWHYQDVMVWSVDGEPWHGEGWRAMTVVSLIVVENLLPEALR